MDQTTKDQLISDGLLLVDRAVSQFIQIKGCENSSTLVKILQNAILLAETIYNIKK